MKNLIFLLSLLATTLVSGVSQTFDNPLETLYFQDQKITIVVNPEKMGDIDDLQLTVSRGFGSITFNRIGITDIDDRVFYEFYDPSYVSDITQYYKACFTVLGRPTCVEPILTVYPFSTTPPISMDELGNLVLYAESDTSEQLFIFDMKGSEVLKQYVDLNRGPNSVPIPTLPSGRYFVRSYGRGVFSFLKTE